MLRAPRTKEEFVHRLREIRSQLVGIVVNDGIYEITLESNPALFRTVAFFGVGEALPLKFVNDDTLRSDFQTETARNLLQGIDLNF